MGNGQPGVSGQRCGKILVVYHHNMSYPLRETLKDLLYSFQRHSGRVCYYVNAAFGLPRYLSGMEFDLIVFHDAFLSKRWLPKRFRKMMGKCRGLKRHACPKIILPQDEFIFTDVLNRFINDYKITHVFSIAQASEWSKIYPQVDRTRVMFKTVLTGYLERKTVQKIRDLEGENIPRDIDLGYRAWKAPYWLGRHGYLKTKITGIFSRAAARYEFKTDLSNEPQDVLLGLDWYRFLLRCKYMIGVESGASILDPDGVIRRKVEDYLILHPQATFEETEERCFKGTDGNLHLLALGPRHLEACATRTCQILVEGEYGGVLKPGLHYIPVKKDFSNLDEVLALAKADTVRETMVARAYRDIVESEQWTYDRYVYDVLEFSMGKDFVWSRLTRQEWLVYQVNEFREKLIWLYIPLRSWVIKIVLAMIPPWLFRRIERFFD